MQLQEIRVSAIKDIPPEPTDGRAFVVYKVSAKGPQKQLVKYRDRIYKELHFWDGRKCTPGNCRPTLKKAREASKKLLEKVEKKKETTAQSKIDSCVRALKKERFLCILALRIHKKRYDYISEFLGLHKGRAKRIFSQGWRDLNYIKVHVDSLPEIGVREFYQKIKDTPLVDLIGPTSYEALEEGFTNVLK